MNLSMTLKAASLAYLAFGAAQNPTPPGAVKSRRSLQSVDDDYAYGYGSNSDKMQLINSGSNALVITSSLTGYCTTGQYCNAFILPDKKLSVPVDSWTELTGNGVGIKSCYSSSVLEVERINSQGQHIYYYDCAVSTLNTGMLQYHGELSGEVLMGQGALDIIRQQVTQDPATDTYNINFSLGDCALASPATYSDNTLRTLAIGGSERVNPVFPDNCFINSMTGDKFNGFEIQIAPALLLDQVSADTDDLPEFQRSFIHYATSFLIQLAF